MANELTAEQVRDLFDYDAEDGHLRWRKKPRGRCAGQIAGGISKISGYRLVGVRLDGRLRTYYAHRLIWLWVHGEWPANHTDHINMDRADNRLANLRLATLSENLANQKVRSKSGFKGVWRHGSNWAASIRKNKVTHHLGTYASPELAHAAYCVAAKSMYGEFARSA